MQGKLSNQRASLCWSLLPLLHASSSLPEPLPLLMLLSSPLPGRGGPRLSVALGQYLPVLSNCPVSSLRTCRQCPSTLSPFILLPVPTHFFSCHGPEMALGSRSLSLPRLPHCSPSLGDSFKTTELTVVPRHLSLPLLPSPHTVLEDSHAPSPSGIS